jgi:hypothetical protein
MIQYDSEKIKEAKAKRKSHISPYRRIGYVVTIIIMIVILYLVQNWQRWNLQFLSSDFSRYLIYIELSIFVNIAANVLFILYDHRWFKLLIQALADIAGALSLIMFYVIFPIVLDSEKWIKWIKIGVIVLFILTLISILVNLIKGIRYLVREPETI